MSTGKTQSWGAGPNSVVAAEGKTYKKRGVLTVRDLLQKVEGTTRHSLQTLTPAPSEEE